MEISERHGRFMAVAGGRTVAVLPYHRRGEVLILDATRTDAENWHTGLAEQFYSRVLEILHSRAQRFEVECPLMRAYLETRTAGSTDAG